MELFKGFDKNEKGSVAVIITLCMTVFIGISAVALDAGLIYITRSRLINAMDAAALAGVQELPHNPQEAIFKAKSFAMMNGIDEDKIIIELIDNNSAIKVSTDKTIEFFFAKFIGYNTGNVEGLAVARIYPISGLNGAVPLGIESGDFIFNQTYNLKVGAGDSESGWFGALALEKPGAANYEQNLKHGFPGLISIGDILDIQTGNISGPTKDAIDYRMLHCNHAPSCNADTFDRNCPRLLKVLVIEPSENKKVKVVGFAMFIVDQVLGQGTDSYITGSFIKTVTTGDIDPDGQSFGLYGVALTH